MRRHGGDPKKGEKGQGGSANGRHGKQPPSDTLYTEMTASPDPSYLVVRPRGRRPRRERLLTAGFRLARFVGARLQQRPVLPSGPCRILVIKPCCLGDVLMTTPVLAALRARFPQAVIDYAE